MYFFQKFFKSSYGFDQLLLFLNNRSRGKFELVTLTDAQCKTI